MDPKEHSKTKSHKLNCDPNHSIGPSHCKRKNILQYLGL